MDFVPLPDAWAGAWIWDAVGIALQDRGHDPITLSGLDENEEWAQ